MKWLPLTFDGHGGWESFIQVPEAIHGFGDVISVLDQMVSLEPDKMLRLEQEVGRMSKPIALMYLLGLIASDGCFTNKKELSTQITLTAGEKYDFAESLGCAFFYCLGKLGIEDRSHSLRESDHPTHLWSSAKTPFLNWMRRSLLGLKTDEPKSSVPLDADWILKAPFSWRVAFLQGLADGDGWASIRKQYTGIATKVNFELIHALFSSVGIDSKIYKNRVQVHKKEAIGKSECLPLFRYATERQDNLSTTVDMLSSMEISQMSQFEKEKALEFYKNGMSTGEIVENLWKEYGIARRPQAITELIKRTKKPQCDRCN